MAAWTDVAREGELPPGQRKIIEIDGARIIVFNLEGHYYAIEDVCSHDGGNLDGAELCGEEIVCPRHGARFSIKTGRVLSPPAFEDIAAFPIRIASGVIQVKDDRWD